MAQEVLLYQQSHSKLGYLKTIEGYLTKGIAMKAKIIAVALAALAGTTGAQAAGLTSLFNSPGSTLLSDNSAELLINVDGSVDGNGIGTITSGDIFVTILGIGDIGGTQIGGVTAYNELTAISALKISGAPSSTFTNAQGATVGVFAAEALSAADSAYFNWATGSILGGTFSFTSALGAVNNGTTFGLVFEDSANDYSRNSGTIQQNITSATGGTAVLKLGIDITKGDAVQVIAPTNLASFGVLPPNTQVASSSIFIDGTVLAENWLGLDFSDNFTAGNGGFASPEASSAWPIYDNLDFTVTANRLPEPGTLALAGLGLLGLSAGRRRKN